MSFEVIKWVYNKTFVEIMKNTVHFRNFEKFWNFWVKLSLEQKSCQDRWGWAVSHRDIHISDYIKLGFAANPLMRRRTSCMNMLKKGRPWFLMKSASYIHRQENQLIKVFQRYCLSSIERWAFRLSKTPLLARFHSNGESGRLDEVRGRRRWVGVLVVELLRI